MVSNMNRNRKYTDKERQVFMYGTELILNSLLKILIYLLVGIAAGKGIEVTVAVCIFGVVRKCSGGIHAKTNLGCFLITGSILASSIYMSGILQIQGKVYVLSSVAVWIIYACLAPCDEYYREKGRKAQAREQKIKTLILVSMILVSGYYLKYPWKMLILCILALQGITLIEVTKDNQEGRADES